MATLTELQKRALKIAPTLRHDQRFTCTILGEALFAEKRFEGRYVFGRPLDMQRFARPGGKVIAGLRKLGLMEPCYRFHEANDPRFWYRLTQAGLMLSHKIH